VRISNTNIQEAFEEIFEAIHTRDFSKSRRLHTKNEKALLLPIRFYLLGRFGQVQPEAVAKMPLGRQGRVDFVLGKTAIELAVKLADDPKRKLLPGKRGKGNSSEIHKLVKHSGRSILVLFDFSKTRSLEDDELYEEYANHSLGKGNHGRTAYELIYFFRKGRQTGCFRRQIRPRRPPALASKCCYAQTKGRVIAARIRVLPRLTKYHDPQSHAMQSGTL
jgi:hypothetical protein